MIFLLWDYEICKSLDIFLIYILHTIQNLLALGCKSPCSFIDCIYQMAEPLMSPVSLLATFLKPQGSNLDMTINV